VIVADTSAVVALIDKGDADHRRVLALYRRDPNAWVLPWSILPEVAYLVGRYGSAKTEQLFLDDIAAGRYGVEWGLATDVARAADLNRRYADLELGLVDTTVMAIAERLKAAAIATLDRRHFGAVTLRGTPALLPD
jgi:uncharacterized protein